MNLFYKKLYGKFLYYSSKIYTPSFEGRYLSDFKKNYKEYEKELVISFAFYSMLILFMISTMVLFKKSSDSIIFGLFGCLVLIIGLKQFVDFCHKKIMQFLIKYSPTKSWREVWNNQKKLRIFLILFAYFYYVSFAVPFVLASLGLLLVGKVKVNASFLYEHIDILMNINNIFIIKFIAAIIKCSYFLTIALIIISSIIIFFGSMTIAALMMEKFINIIFNLVYGIFFKNNISNNNIPEVKILDKDIVIVNSKKKSDRELDSLFKK